MFWQTKWDAASAHFDARLLGAARWMGGLGGGTAAGGFPMLRRRVSHPRLLRIEDYGRLGYGVHFRLRKPSDVDRELVALMREAYAAAVRGS